MPILSTALTLDNGVIVSEQLLMLEASVPESLFQFRVASVSDSESHVLVTRKNQASDSDEVVSYRLSDGYKTEYSLPYLGTHGSVDTRFTLTGPVEGSFYIGISKYRTLLYLSPEGEYSFALEDYTLGARNNIINKESVPIIVFDNIALTYENSEFSPLVALEGMLNNGDDSYVFGFNGNVYYSNGETLWRVVGEEFTVISQGHDEISQRIYPFPDKGYFFISTFDEIRGHELLLVNEVHDYAEVLETLPIYGLGSDMSPVDNAGEYVLAYDTESACIGDSFPLMMDGNNLWHANDSLTLPGQTVFSN